MTEAYPHLEKPPRIGDAVGTEYGKKYSTLRHMLAAGRNWNVLQQAFSLGILALVPPGARLEYEIPSMSAFEPSIIHRTKFNRIERVPAPVFDAFLAILVKLRGDFIRSVSSAISERISDILDRRDLYSRYKFETIDARVLRSHSLDAPDLVDLCGTE